MGSIKRRNFIKLAALSTLPLGLPALPAMANVEDRAFNPGNDTDVYILSMMA